MAQVLRYAAKVKKNPEASCVAGLQLQSSLTEMESGTVELTRRKASLGVFAIMIIICILGYVPWSVIPVGEGLLVAALIISVTPYIGLV